METDPVSAKLGAKNIEHRQFYKIMFPILYSVHSIACIHANVDVHLSFMSLPSYQFHLETTRIM